MIIDFRTSRFLLLLRKFSKENRKIYLLYSAGFFGILLLAYGIIVLSSLHSIFPRDLQQVLFVFGLLLGGSFFSASFYGFFAYPSKGIQFLQLPVSNSEKLLLSFMCTQFVYFFTFMLIFLFTDWILCAFYNQFAAIPDGVTPIQLTYYKATRLDLGDLRNLLAILAFFILSSIAHFGSLTFTKHAFVKTAIVFIIVWTTLGFYNQYLMVFLIPVEIMPHGMFFTDSFRIGPAKAPVGLVTLSEQWSLSISYTIPVIIYASFWTGSYFKLKEKQV